jgi:predicted kinase
MSLIIPVGLPGCGKSTWPSSWDGNWAVISTDEIRIQLTGDVNEMRRNDEVFDLFHDYIKASLGEGSTVYVDATNLRDFARATLRAIANLHDVPVHAIVFTNTEEAVTRNLARDRVVPADVMARFALQFEQALKDIPQEGYDSITYISSFQ